MTLAEVDESPGGPLLDRLVSIMFVGAAAGFVWFLAPLAPDPRGYGTHEQLGMAACGWAAQGTPCPTCRVTTATTHLVQLHLLDAIRTQPFGAALAGFSLWLAGVAAWCLVRGRSYLDYLLRLPYGSLVVCGVVLLLASWVYVYVTFTP